MSRILTTLVGSYPTPQWLLGRPGEQAMRDAATVVLHTQELAGIDLLADGEIYRFNPDHPETNGMIEYFVQPMDGVRTAVTRADIELFRSQSHLDFRRRPSGDRGWAGGTGNARPAGRVPGGRRVSQRGRSSSP